MYETTPAEYEVSPDGKSYTLYPSTPRSVRYVKYEYTRLSSKRSIRLLSPSHDRTQIEETPDVRVRFKVEERSLDSNDFKFVAISYVWGDKQATAPLVLEDARGSSVLLVTKNAWQAVQRLCILGQLPVWIDQICINQGEEEEKEVQIDLMAEIYSHPNRFVTAVWLGAADAETIEAMKFTDLLNTAFPSDEIIPINSNDALGMPHDLIETTVLSRCPRYNPPPSDHRGWAALAKIFNRLWFVRMWTFLEAVSCKNDSVSFVSGNAEVTCFTTLRKLIRASVLLGDYPLPEYTTATTEGRVALNNIVSIQQRLRERTPVPLRFLLDRTSVRDCEHPRDKIYALIGVQSRDSNPIVLRTNLRRSDKDLYMDVTKRIILQESSIHVSLTAEGRQDGRVAGLPSWVPDYSAKQPARAIDNGFPEPTVFSASDGVAWTADGSHQNLPQEQLTVRGRIIVDTTIEVIETDMPSHPSADNIYNHLRGFLPRLFSQTDRSQDTMLRIARTVILDGHDSELYGVREFSFITKATRRGDRVNAEDLTMLRHMFGIDDARGLSLITEDRQRRWKHDFVKQAASCVKRRFARTMDYGWALVPESIKATDCVAILHGSRVPVVLRAGGGDKFELVGPCFVDGIMRGEAADWKKKPAVPFILI